MADSVPCLKIPRRTRTARGSTLEIKILKIILNFALQVNIRVEVSIELFRPIPFYSGILYIYTDNDNSTEL